MSDEASTTIGGSPAIGNVTYVQIILNGLPIVDTDRDGLDDNWERQHFGNLTYGPKDDPDGDGFNNAREQSMGTDPMLANAALNLDIAELKPGYWRLSWPANETRSHGVFSGGNLSQPLSLVTNVPGRLPAAEFIFQPGGSNHFYRVRQNSP